MVSLIAPESQLVTYASDRSVDSTTTVTPSSCTSKDFVLGRAGCCYARTHGPIFESRWNLVSRIFQSLQRDLGPIIADVVTLGIQEDMARTEVP